ncbi:DUF309 domain-containing protein [Bacillus suaedaesalsae]|uniref:DUF309 domain-containing protein n=1 Tax=Bacillus suaedaesalsae TaxID=2810349 RepID=A0ABS2DQ72_9BACI|nr:DUF309 domain-containing protein [Bacillus suaedaesalsae]MBM6619933.1 DUF309 domain-containing protein [Bacillus suaedaesalsae]
MYPRAYIEYLVHFHGDRDYFECHEILEEYWKEDERGKRKEYWVAFIQVAVSLYHHRRSNFGGARRMMKNALSIFEKEKEAILKLGLDDVALLALIRKQMISQEKKEPYRSISLPIKDSLLLKLCLDLCSEKDITWLSDSDLNNELIVNKHKLRDRSDVIEEREQQKKMKQRKYNL